MNDYAGLLPAGDRTRLEARLAERERATSTQMVIAIFRSLEGESLEDVSIRLAERWRVGQKALDNGVILVVFVEDRKVRLEVGYGLEGALPDALATQIIREQISPRFREGRYAAGLEGAIEAVFARAEATPVAQRPRGKGQSPLGVSWVALLFILGVIVFVVMGTLRSRGRASAFTASGRGWSTPVIVPPIFWGGGGWGRGGGGSGDGGFTGGGGSFGGGGASGDW